MAGRGRSATLPAWMTAGGGANPPPVEAAKPSLGADARGAPSRDAGPSDRMGGSGVGGSYSSAPPTFQQHMRPPMSHQGGHEMQRQPPNMGGMPYGGHHMPPPMQMQSQQPHPHAQHPHGPPMAAPPSQVTWRTYTDSSGKEYYHNAATGTTTYEKPDELKSDLEKSLPPCDWSEYSTDDKRKYWYNGITKQSVWVEPPEFTAYQIKLKEIQSEAAAAGPPQETPAPTPSVAPQIQHVPMVPQVQHMHMGGGFPPPMPIPFQGGMFGGGPPPGLPFGIPPAVAGQFNLQGFHAVNTNGMGALAAWNAEQARLQAQRDALKEGGGVSNVHDGPSVNDGGGRGDASKEDVEGSEDKKKKKKEKAKVVVQGAIPKFTSIEERKSAFEKLLLDKNIKPGTIWAEVVVACESDGRYVGVGKVGFKRQLYSEWTSKRRKEEVYVERSKKRKLRDDFQELLEESRRINDKTRWKEAETFLGNDPRFLALDDNPNLRKELFEDYMQDLVTRAATEAKKKQAELEESFKQLLSTNLKITAKTEWEDAKDELRGNIIFESLDKSVRRRVFDSHINALLNRNRKAYMDMLERKIAEGVISYGYVKWRDVEDEIIKTEEFILVDHQQSGPSPRKLFDDLMLQCERNVKGYAKEVEDLYQTSPSLSSGKGLGEDTTLTDFINQLKVAYKETGASGTFASLVEASPIRSEVKATHGYLIARIITLNIEREKKEKKLRDRYLDLCAELFYRSHHLETTWEEAMEKLRGYPEFDDIEDPVLREKYFHTHMQDLREFKAKHRGGGGGGDETEEGDKKRKREEEDVGDEGERKRRKGEVETEEFAGF